MKKPKAAKNKKSLAEQRTQSSQNTVGFYRKLAKEHADEYKERTKGTFFPELAEIYENLKDSVERAGWMLISLMPPEEDVQEQETVRVFVESAFILEENWHRIMAFKQEELIEKIPPSEDISFLGREQTTAFGIAHNICEAAGCSITGALRKVLGENGHKYEKSNNVSTEYSWLAQWKNLTIEDIRHYRLIPPGCSDKKILDQVSHVVKKLKIELRAVQDKEREIRESRAAMIRRYTKNMKASNTSDKSDTPVTLREFMFEHCEALSKNLLERRVKALQGLNQKKKLTPALERIGEYARGKSDKYLPSFLIDNWPQYIKKLPTLPILK